MADNVNSTTGHELEAINVQDSKAQFQKFKNEVVDQGYKPNVHTGLADNLFGSTQTNDVFTFRPTAGIQDVASGDAPVGGGTIKKVEGNTVVWNQLLQYNHIQATMAHEQILHIQQGVTYLENHKYIARVAGLPSGIFFQTDGVQPIGNMDGDSGKSVISVIGTASRTFYDMAYFINHNDSSTDIDVHISIIDLTLLGIDNLTTVEEVEAWLANNIGLKDYYPYSAGELIPVKDFKVKSVGFNLWDEEWELGYIYNGNNYSANDRIRSKNMIKCLPNTRYFYHYKKSSAAINIFYYDADGNYISNVTRSYDNGVTTPENCHYIRFYMGAAYGNTYNHDICINLSYNGDRDGEYEEHWEREVGIDVTKVYGKLNGAGESVQVFPDGLKSAGTVHDEIVKRGEQVVAIKRVGKFTMTNETSLDIIKLTSMGANCAFVTLSDRAHAVYNVLSNLYAADNNGVDTGTQTDISIRGAADTDVCVKDSSKLTLGMTATQVRDALIGLEIIYVLATPQEYILDEDILPVQYRVDNYGTEEVLLGNDEGLVSSSPKMTISYGINAADTIADLPHSYVSVLPQQLDEDKQKQARRNINAASQDSIIRIQEQLDAINPKVDNDVYVDMGLPSGLLWAKRNLDVTQPDGFAASPFQYECSFFSWGNVDGHNPISTTEFDYEWGTSMDGPYASTPGATIQYPSSAGLSFDIARKTLGAPWRLPSADDFKELIDNCKFVQTDGETEIDVSQVDKRVTVNGILGIYLKSKINGKLLFFSCSGHGYDSGWAYREWLGLCWSSSLYSGEHGLYLWFGPDGVNPQYNYYRYLGCACRPVM